MLRETGGVKTELGRLLGLRGSRGGEEMLGSSGGQIGRRGEQDLQADLESSGSGSGGVGSSFN